MEFADLIHALAEELQKPLPGRAAQLKMSSMTRMRELMKWSVPESARLSSVLILLYPFRGTIGLVLMLRPDYRGVHSRQISLPGGKKEETDESLIFTALREASEEIGIEPGQVRVIGQLTELYIPPSNFLVTPIVGYSSHTPVFRADPGEVERIIQISLKDLMDERNRMIKKIRISVGLTLNAPAYCLHGDIIWGATAMMLSEFLEIVARIGGSQKTAEG
jgi:8-oxo-dGTP pyrophosphatase MutT (NUDIX family)